MKALFRDRQTGRARNRRNESHPRTFIYLNVSPLDREAQFLYPRMLSFASLKLSLLSF